MPKRNVDHAQAHKDALLQSFLRDVMSDVHSSHPSSLFPLEVRGVAERALRDLIAKGQRDPSVLASFARARAITTIRIRG